MNKYFETEVARIKEGMCRELQDELLSQRTLDDAIALYVIVIVVVGLLVY